MSHIKIIALLLLLFFKISANANAVCILMEKNVELRKYSFKCDNEIVNIQCEIKNKNICSVNIKEKLKSLRFDLTDDQLNALNLFSAATQEKAVCNASEKICSIEKQVCNKYKGTFDEAKTQFEKTLSFNSRCKNILGEGVQTAGIFSSGFISESEFSKDKCENISSGAITIIKNKISIFKQNINLPFSNPQSLLNRCVGQGDTSKDLRGHAEMVRKKTSSLAKFRDIILKKMDSPEQLKSLACVSGNEIFYENGRLDIDNFMCAITEESVIELRDNGVTCKFGISNLSSRFADQRTSEKAGAALAKADITPIEQKPMPEAMASQIGKPVGLTPALAQVDQAVPGSGSAAGVTPSEGTMAAGAVRSTIPTAAAVQAGQAFAPVYQKLSNMAKSVPTSGRSGVIGRSSSPGNLSGATGVVTVTRKNPSSNSTSTVDPDALIAAGSASAIAAGSVGEKSGSTDSGTAEKPSLQRSAASVPGGPIGGGPRSLGLGSGGGSSSGSSGSSGNVADGASNTESFNSEAIAKAQKKVTQLNSPAQINSFFKEEAGELRDLIYSDDKLSKLLASKGIRVMNQAGDVAGESLAKAKYVFRDDGSKFTPLKVAKK